MTIRRRGFIRQSLTALAAALAPPEARAASPAKFRLAVTDWNLRLAASPEAVGLAERCGFAGVQVALGRRLVEDKLPLDNPEVQQTYLTEAKKHGIALTSTCLDRLHVNYLKNDPLAQKWVLDAIRITRALGLKVILLPFFGNGAIEARAEMDYMGDLMRELGPEAEKAGVVLGLEDTISAEDNVRIMERSRSRAVLTYYDIGNSFLKGFDPVREIFWLGRERICEVHVKDNPHYLGAGKIDVPGVVEALAAIGYQEWAILETECPSGDVVADMRRNRAYLLGLMDTHNARA